jgi:hypothetical protein
VLRLITQSHELLDAYRSIANHFFIKIIGCSSDEADATDSSVLADFYALFLQLQGKEGIEWKEAFQNELNLLNKIDHQQIKENFNLCAQKWIAPAMLYRVREVYGITMTDIHQPLVQVFEFLQSHGLES